MAREEVDLAPLIEKFQEFYAARYDEQISSLASVYPDRKSLIVDYSDLDRFDFELANQLLSRPDIVVEAAEKALIAMNRGMPEAKFEPHVRFFSVPDRGLLIQDIGSKNIEELIAVKGVITKRADVVHRVKIAVYKCMMCDATFKVPVTKKYSPPQVCESCKRRSLKLEEDESYFVDLQKAEAQELLERLKGGAPAAHIELWLEDDLVNTITPGDTVEIVGVMRIRPPIKYKGKSQQMTYTRFVDVVHCRKMQRDFEEIETSKEEEKQILELSRDPQAFEKIRRSVAPAISGHDEVKEALTLQIFGGTREKQLVGGGKIRDDIHILLIGDPGVAKTRFLQSITSLAPKSIYVSGKSVTGVGLTASAEKDELGEGGWTLKAGALVLASGGIAAVDEFDKIEDYERAAMHEVMESQSYHKSTRLLLANGKEVEMGKFVENLLSENKGRVKEGKDCLILDSGLEGIKVLTTDFDKIYPVQISQVSKHKAPESFVHVTLQNGRELIVTPEHPFWTVENGSISTIPASELKRGAFTTAPSIIPINPQNPAQEAENPALFKFLGYHISDGGYELNRRKKNGINFHNKDRYVMQDYLQAAHAVFDSDFLLSTDQRTGVEAARLISMDAVGKLCAIDPALMEKGPRKWLPQSMLGAPASCAKEFLRSIFEGDGSISKRGALGLVCENMRLAHQVQTLLLRFGVESHIIKDGNVIRLYSTGESNLAAFASKIGFISGRKQTTLLGCISGKTQNSPRRNWAYSEVIPGCGLAINRVMASLKLTKIQTFGHVASHTSPAFSRPLFAKAVLALRQRVEKIKEMRMQIGKMGIGQLCAERKSLGISQADLGGPKLRSLVCYWERNGTMENRYRLLFEECCARMLSCEPQLEKLEGLLNGQVRFCKIKNIKTIRNETEEWVYDVGAGPTKAFVSECAILHNTVSIAKAGIVAKFKAKTAVLAAANPKLGRFDQNKLPGEQFDIPPTLLSRFDLIFPIIDIMDEEQDSKLADHILASHKKAAQRKPAEEAPVSEAEAIDVTMLRKYISYARKNIRPVISEEAMGKIKDFYVQLRKHGRAQGGAVPITPRYIEGLIRMTEASAKVRLSNEATAEDSDRAIKLVQWVLDKIMRDRETGRYDADIIATGRPKSQVDKINTITGIIRELAKEYDQIEVNKVIGEAAGFNIDEVAARRIIDELANKGEIYRVRHGFIKLVEQSG